MNDTNVEVSFEDMSPSPTLRDEADRQLQQLRTIAGPIQDCHVVIRQREHHSRNGHYYEVHVRLCQDGKQFEGGRTARPNHSHADPYVAVHDAFTMLRRRLTERHRRNRA